MSSEGPPSTALGNQGTIELEFAGQRVRIDREPEVAAPNYYTDAVLDALEAWPGTPGAVLDVGTGTGILAIAASLRWPDSRIDGIDVDPAAIRLAEANARANGLGPERCAMHLGAASAYRPRGRYDLIVANPPQIPVPPEDESLSGAGPDGTQVAAQTVALAARAMSDGGKLLLALADFVPSEPIQQEVTGAGLAMDVHGEVACLAGSFTSAHRAWIERDGYRFVDAPGGLGFSLRLLVVERL